MPSLAALRPFGVIHVDDPEKVTRELREFAADADAIFIEHPSDPLNALEYVELLVRAPLYVFGMLALQVVAYSPLYLLFNRDLFQTELVAARRIVEDADLPLHAVDEHPNRQLLDGSVRVTLANWALLAPALVLEPIRVPAAVALVALGGLLPVLVRRYGRRYAAMALVPVGFVAFAAAVVVSDAFFFVLLAGVVVALVTVLRTVDRRNEAMVERACRLSAEEGYDDAVLVTGKAHVGGVVRLARDRGLTVPSVHLSNWRSDGTTHAEFEATEARGVDLPDLRDFRTTPRVVPGSERTSLGRRVVAALVDLVLAAALWFLGLVVLVGVAGDPFVDGATGVQLAGVLSVWGLAVGGYHALLEWRFGMTVGKYLLGLAVVDDAQDLPSGRTAVVRNVVRPVGALLAYAPGGVTALASSGNRTLGDRLAGTYVCRRKPSSDDSTTTSGSEDAAVASDDDGEAATDDAAVGDGASPSER